MKKFKAFILPIFILMISLSITACGAKTEAPKTSAPVQTTTKAPVVTTQKPATQPVAENRVVKGYVKSGDTPVAQATVRIRNTNYNVETNQEGYFEIEITESKEELAEFRLMISKEGYESTTFDVRESSFTGSIAQVDINILSSSITLSGTVTDKDGQPIENVSVSILNSDNEVKTDAQGAYSFTIDRPVSLTLVFQKNYYKVIEEQMSNFEGESSFTKNVTLEDNLVTISGTVSNAYTGAIEGATVSINGTTATTTSDAEGHYSIADVLVPNDSFKIEVSKEGYMSASYGKDDAENLELIEDYHKYAQMDLYEGEKLEGYVTKSSKALYFKYILDDFKYEAGKEEKVQLYINPGKYTDPSRLPNTDNPDGGHAIEIALTSNNGIVVFVNYYKGTTFVTNILWGTELKYEVAKENDKTVLTLYVEYGVFGNYCGEDFAIDKDSIIGLGLNFFTDFNDEHLYAWYLDDMLGVDGKPVVHHDKPQDWVRLSKDGKTIYEGSSNTPFDLEERTVTGKVYEVEDVKTADANNSTYMLVNSEHQAKVGESINVSMKLEGTTLTMTYTGPLAQIADTREFWQFISFDNFQTKYDIRFKKDWTGVYNWTTGAWEAWNAKIGNPVYTEDGDNLTITQTIDLSFFTDLGKELGDVMMAIKSGSDTLEYTRNKPVEGAIVAVPQFGASDTVSVEVKTADANNSTYMLVNSEHQAKVGESINVSMKLEGTTLTMTYTGPLAQIADTREFWQFISFDNFQTKYDIRFKKDWTGVYNWTTGAWEAWNAKIGNPVYTEDGDNLTITQTIDLSFFTDLGKELGDVMMAIKSGSDTLVYTKRESAEGHANYELEYNVFAITNDKGEYTLVIPANKIAVDTINLLFTKEGYVDTQAVLVRTDFTENAASLNKIMEEGKTAVTVKGYVLDGSDNPISGATVKIQGTTISTTTNAEGYFEFVEVEHDEIPYVLTFTVDGYYLAKRTVNDLITVDALSVKLEARPEEVAETPEALTLTKTDVLIGKMGPDEVEAYLRSEDGMLNITFKYADGTVTTVPEELLKIYLNFKDSDVIYSVRNTVGGWTGVYNEKTKAYETWNTQIGNLVIKAVGDNKVGEMTIDLNFFAALGQDISEVKVSFAEFTDNNDRPVIYGTKALSTNNTAKFLPIVLPKQEITEGMTVELTGEDQVVGAIDAVTVSMKASGTNLTTTFTGTIDPNTEWSIYLKFNTETVYEIRFKSGWVGIWNKATSSWEAWNSKVQNPSYTETGVSQTTDLTFFTALGVSLDNVICYVSCGAKGIKYTKQVTVKLSDTTTFVDMKETADLEGTIGDATVELVLNENTLTTTITNVGDESAEWSIYLKFDTDTIYEIRFKSGWVGIWNKATSSWEAWNAKVDNPTYADGNATQVTDLSFFTALGVSLEHVYVCPAKGATQFKYSQESAASFADQASWMTLSLPE